MGWDFLVVQGLKICLPMQGTRVRSLMREDPTCCGAAKPVGHNCRAHVLQALKPMCLGSLLAATRGQPPNSSEDLVQSKTDK